MSAWGWQPERTQGIWRYGAVWLKPLVVAAPWLTVLLLLFMLFLVGGTLTSAKGLLFDLPSGSADEGMQTDMVALIMPTERETLVFFDDARYLLDDPASAKTLGDHLAERVGGTGKKALLVLADRRVSGGELMRFAGIARKSGVAKMLFAEKTKEKTE